jgi:hypothetical protein
MVLRELKYNFLSKALNMVMTNLLELLKKLTYLEMIFRLIGSVAIR